jgi:hypothetical protein
MKPTIDDLAGEARDVLMYWQRDLIWYALKNSAQSHLRRWPSLTGIMLIDQLDLDQDAAPLLESAARVLSIRAAAYALGSDDPPELLPAPVPVDEAVHALTMQIGLLRGIAERGDVCVPSSSLSPLRYDTGCLTHQIYQAAWGEPPARLWLDRPTIIARRLHLNRLYAAIGITLPAGRHSIDFPAGRPATTPASGKFAIAAGERGGLR